MLRRETRRPDRLPSLDLHSLAFERLLFFSDAVFAIAVTLLALDIRIPQAAAGLAHPPQSGSLMPLLSRLLVYGVGFIVVGSIWVGHHRIFQYIRGFDDRLVLLNLVFLMFVAAAPIPTRILADYLNSRGAAVFFAVYMGVTSLLQAFIWHYAIRGHRLVEPGLDTRFGTIMSYTGPAIFLVSILLLSFSPAWVAEASWLSIWLVQGIERRIYFGRPAEAQGGDAPPEKPGAGGPMREA